MRLAAAIQWYENRRISQGTAAEIAGLSRAEFLQALGRAGVSPFQYTADEIAQEAQRLVVPPVLDSLLRWKTWSRK
jgi:predicted HTH domain antitoxin